MKQQTLLAYFGEAVLSNGSNYIDLTGCPTGAPVPINSRSPFVPRYKVIAEGPYAIDAFSYGAIKDVSCYFLTHFHSDHYCGLNSKWKHGPIYCSPITASLLAQQLKIHPKFINPIELNVPFVLPDSKGIVTFFDANHCPGSVMIQFDFHLANLKILHTGDFRYDPKVPHFSKLFQEHFQRVYFDDTYWNPKYAFTSQSHAIQQAILEIERISRGKSSLILVGSYLIGKERVFLRLAEHFRARIFVSRWKRKIMNLLEIPSFETFAAENPKDAQIHVLPMSALSWKRANQYFSDYWPQFQQAIAVIPTGWTNSEKPKKAAHFYPKNSEKIPNSIHFVQVPYSEHSSYSELVEFVSKMNSNSFIATSSGTLRGKAMEKTQLLG